MISGSERLACTINHLTACFQKAAYPSQYWTMKRKSHCPRVSRSSTVGVYYSLRRPRTMHRSRCVRATLTLQQENCSSDFPRELIPCTPDADSSMAWTLPVLK